MTRFLALLVFVMLCVGGPVSAVEYSFETETAQRVLTELGHYSGTVDGKWGKQTARAIQAFQKKSGLPATGSLDGDTLERLRVAGAPLSDPQVLTLQGTVEYINRKTGPCLQDNAIAPLPNKMLRRAKLTLRNGQLVLRITNEVTPYEASSDVLSPVESVKRAQFDAAFVSLTELKIQPKHDPPWVDCYTLEIRCIRDAECITKDGRPQNKSVSAVFDATPGDIPLLSRAWEHLFSRLGASADPPGEEGVAEESPPQPEVAGNDAVR